eukprot:Hpha_TRINITY_DN15946_c2_g1::TRINITY_DN15946_c2_g1_i1::g.73123::m.73123
MPRHKTGKSPRPVEGEDKGCGWVTWILVGLGSLLLFGAAGFFLIRREDAKTAQTPTPAASAPAPPAPNPAAPEVGDLLASLGLIEYSTVFNNKGLASLQVIAKQREDRGPQEVRQFHWRQIVKESRSRLAGVRTSSIVIPKDEPDETPAPPMSAKDAAKEAKEDDDVELQPKSRTKGECHVTRHFLEPLKTGNNTPPIFWSFPGSGNTWIRFLIEQATGTYTGSVYQDLDIIKLMPGEMRCDNTVVAVKGHPNWTPFDLVDGAYKMGGRFWINGSDPSNPIGSGTMDLEQWHGIVLERKRPVINAFYKKCQIGINRALVVTRDPYAALWAEYQRLKSEVWEGNVKVGFGHVAMLLKKDYDPIDMRKHLMSLIQDWFLQFVGYEGFIERHGCESVLFQPFEEMVSLTTRDFAIKRMVTFLRRPMVTTPECAFRLADHPQIRRAKTKNPDAMTMADAYNDPRLGDLVCDMWEIAGREMSMLGYAAPKMGPRKGKCPDPRRESAAVSKHAVLTAGTFNCRADRIPGQSGVNYFLVPDMYENATTASNSAEFEDCSDCPTRKKKEEKRAADAQGVDETVVQDSGERPYLTFAVVGRNDNHSGNAVERLQNQLINVIAYAARYEMYVEVIVVEWNPEPDRKRLPKILNIPSRLDARYVTIRILTVSKQLHEVAVEPPIHMPVQQYIGKNIAIRRAHGDFVVAWNGDMLLTKHFWERAKRRDFKKRIYYRIDRLDMDKPLPKEFDVGDLEKEREEGFVQLHVYQIRTAVGTRKLKTSAEKAQFWYDFYHTNDTTGKFAERCCNAGCELEFKSCRWKSRMGWTGDMIRAEVPKLVVKGDMKGIEDIMNLGQHFHANAPGDFLMMHRDDWMQIRGYPEAPYQDEMDKYPMPQAFCMGMDQEILAPPIASIHQYHAASWGAGDAMSEDMKNRPSLGPRKYIEDSRNMLISKKAVTLWGDPNELGCNHKDWGFGNIALRESLLIPLATNSTRNSLRVVRQPFDQLDVARTPGCGWKYKPPARR